MDPSYFAHWLGAFLAAMPPGACDSRGMCHPWYDDRHIAPQYRSYAPPPHYFQPQTQSPDELGIMVKAEIYRFCTQHPDERFCGLLEAYLQKHPDAR
jgi:hypothetical protein